MRLSKAIFSQWVIIGLSLVLIVGCSSRKIDWDSRLGAYSFDEAVLELGPPDKDAELSDGTRVAEWLTFRSQSEPYGGYAAGYAHPGRYRTMAYGFHYGTFGNTGREYWIRLTFDPSGQLLSWRKVTR
ncbi:MAG: hypothetical protein RI897_361 [Verrucomicrobiota bacterium]|jgi:hypothetical protein